MANQPWWTFNRIDNFGTIDPQPGTGWKPDSNIQLPGNYPIVALLPGKVTAVQRTSWGQSVVTVKLDQPLNDLATHTFYEHMSSASVQVGQRVNQGDLIGYNNPTGQVPLGFGLYSGDVYGSGSAWQQLQNDLKPGGNGKLNPTGLLDSAKNGDTSLKLYLAGVGVSAPPGPKPNLGPCAFTPDPNPIVYSGQVMQNMLCNLQQSMVSWGEHIAIFVIALILIIVGLLLIGFKPAENAVNKIAGSKAVKAATLA